MTFSSTHSKSIIGNLKVLFEVKKNIAAQPLEFCGVSSQTTNNNHRGIRIYISMYNFYNLILGHWLNWLHIK